jgi:hypothetical protein
MGAAWLAPLLQALHQRYQKLLLLLLLLAAQPHLHHCLLLLLLHLVRQPFRMPY